MPSKVIAIDVGYGNTKVVWGLSIDETGKEQWNEVCFRSAPQPALVDEKQAGDFFYNKNSIHVKVKDKAFLVGPSANAGATPRVLGDDYIESDEYEALLIGAIHIAMREMGKLFNEVETIVVGLPVSSFTSRRERLREIVMQPHLVPVPKSLDTFGIPALQVKAKKVIVLPQPYGGLRYASNHLQDDDPMFEENSMSMVIDPGYKTFDWFVTENMEPKLDKSGSFTGGSSTILRDVSQKIAYDHGLGSLELDVIEDGLKKGNINLGFRVIDTTSYRATALDAARREVLSFITRIDAEKTRLSRIFLTGGGAGFYQQALEEKFKGYKFDTVPNPVMGNARGFWLIGADEAN